jgi:hypothetical protein
MSLVDLTAMRLVSATPMPVIFGQSQRPSSGGQAFRVDRLGNRWAFMCTTPPMPIEPDGRIWQTEFNLAERFGGTVRIKQPNFVAGPLGNPTVAADTASGRTVPLTGLTPSSVIRRGQFVSIVSDGRRYLDRVTEQVVADSGGEAEITTLFLLRVPLSEGDVVELGQPKIEGTIDITTPFDWSRNRLTSCAFTITEDA